MLPERIGPYRIASLLGEGGMGQVYEAVQEPIARRVALKVLHPEYSKNRDILERFFNEARAVNLIEHPSLVQITDFGYAEDGTAYIAMEFLRGETLGKRLHRMKEHSEQLSPTQALYYAWQVADALGAAHDKGIIHRDLKPDNLMLVPEPIAPGGVRVKLLDFGIAKLLGTGQKGTSTHALMGTPRYMSPEQCRGAGHVDDKTDVYALGVIVYEMLAGRPPFLAEEPIGFLSQHLFETPPPLRELAPQVPDEIAALTHRLLAKDKTQRPTMRKVQAAVERILSRTKVAHVPSRSGTPVEIARDEEPRPIPTTGLMAGQGVNQKTMRRWRIVSVFMIGLFGTAVALVPWHRLYKPRPLTPSNVPAPMEASVRSSAMQDVEPAQKTVRVVTPPIIPTEKVEAPSAMKLPPPKVMVHWEIRSAPPDAVVLSSSGAALGKTPWAHPQERAPGSKTIRLRHTGFEELTLTLDQMRDESREVTLHALPLQATHPAAGPRPGAGPIRTPPPPRSSPPAQPPSKVDYVD